MFVQQKDAVAELEKNNQLIRIKKVVSPNLEMAAIHRYVQKNNGPALLFENVERTRFPVVSNLYGTLERCRMLFPEVKEKLSGILEFTNHPLKLIQSPVKNIPVAWKAFKILPSKQKFKGFKEVGIKDLPQIKNWPADSGAFITRAQVYTEDINHPGIYNSKISVNRIQLSGNDYRPNEEIGLHYQIHRALGFHQAIANTKDKQLKVSIFIGGPPAHLLASSMPLPIGINEATMAGVLGESAFRYSYDDDGFCINNDADFVITGILSPDNLKQEGSFGNAAGYYSQPHLFPVLKIKKVYARKEEAVWNFTVENRPPSENAVFNNFINQLTDGLLKKDIRGLKEFSHLSDKVGVPVLLAVGRERYISYLSEQKPAELLNIAHRLLGHSQFNLTKFLWITADEEQAQLTVGDIKGFLQFILKRIDWERDIHFQTRLPMDAIDAFGENLNKGSQVVFAAFGKPKRTLGVDVPEFFKNLPYYENPQIIMPGILIVQMPSFQNYENTQLEMQALSDILMVRPEEDEMDKFPLIVMTEYSDKVSENFEDFLWQTFTRCEPADDIYGVNSFYENKHWGCHGSLIIDARKKTHHSDILKASPEIADRIKPLFEKGGVLYDYR